MSTVTKIKDNIHKRSRNITQWSIDHPFAIIAFFVGLLALAIFAITSYMPRRMMPYVESPLIGIVTMMPGFSAKEMEIYISKPIEEQMVNIKNVRYIRSTSQDGFSIVSLELPYGSNIQRTLIDVQSAMNIIQSSLPSTGANLKPSWVIPIDPLNIPILSLSLRGDKSQGWNDMILREFADNEAVNRLKKVENVYSVVPFGGYRRQLQVVVDRDKLAAYGISILDLKRIIDAYNISASGGTLTYSYHEAIVRVDTRILNAQSLQNIPIASITAGSTTAKPFVPQESTGGMETQGAAQPGMEGTQSGTSPPVVDANTLNQNSTVYLRDVAHVKDTYWEKRSGYHYVHDGKIEPSIEVSVIQDPAASSAQVVPAVLKEIRNIEKDNPGIKFDIAYDNAHFVNILFRNMFEELALAIILTGIVVLLFLGEWRGALISLITIPTSLALAILVLIPLGMSLNSGTLIGLLVAIGRLVDDSIIDIHAVERHMRMGKSPVQAAVDGITEVRLAVIASTFMLVLALLPLLFSGGIVQLMFKELVVPIIVALLASMFVSFTLTGLLAASFLRRPEELEKEKKSFIYVYLINPFQNFLGKLEQSYAKTIDWLLGNRFANMIRILITVAIGFGFYYFIGSEMMPLADVGQAYGVVETVPGTSYQQTEKIVTQIEQIMLKYPEIEKVSTEIGTESLFESFSPFFTGYAMNQVNSASFMITLSDKDKRKRTIWQVVDAVQEEAIRTIPGIRRFQIKEMGSDVMASSAAPITLLAYGKDLDILDKIGEGVLKVAKDTPGMYQPATSWESQMPSYDLKIDYVKAQEAGLTPYEISQQVYYAMRGGLTNEFYRLPNIRQNTILIRYEQDQRKNPVDLENMYLTTRTGAQIKLKSVATLGYNPTPTVIEHDGLRRVKSILGYYRNGGPPSMDLSMNVLMNAMAYVNFPPGYGLEMRGDMTQMMDSFRRLLYGLVLAFFFMLLVLIAQFRGFLQPLQMIFSLPLELAGVFFALWLLGQNFSTVSILAVIVLTGMDITTAILIIDQVMRYRDRGMPRNEAVRRAAPERLRPILMTSIITIITMLPVALFPRTGMDAYSPLGTVIIGGLVIGTILSLFDIPIMHTYVDDLNRWAYRKFYKKEYEWPVTEPEETNIDQGEVEPHTSETREISGKTPPER